MPCLGLELLEEKKLFKLTYNGIVYYIIYKHVHGCICKGISYRSADPGLHQGRGGACDHRRCGPGTLQSLPNPPNTVPSRHPRAKATSQTGTPGPRPQQWLSMGFQSCRLPAANAPNPPNPPNPPNSPKPSKPSKHSPQQAPQGQGHFPNRHPRAKATAMAFYWLSKLPFASPQTLQTLQNPPNPPNHPKPSKPSKHPPKPSKPSKHPPQQAPQGQGHFPNRHPRAKATA